MQTLPRRSTLSEHDFYRQYRSVLKLPLAFQSSYSYSHWCWLNWLHNDYYNVYHYVDPWTVQWSRTQKRLYFFNMSNRNSVFEYPPESIASFKWVLISPFLKICYRKIWNLLYSVFPLSSSPCGSIFIRLWFLYPSHEFFNDYHFNCGIVLIFTPVNLWLWPRSYYFHWPHVLLLQKYKYK